MVEAKQVTCLYTLTMPDSIPFHGNKTMIGGCEGLFMRRACFLMFDSKTIKVEQRVSPLLSLCHVAGQQNTSEECRLITVDSNRQGEPQK